MKPASNLTGESFGRLTVVERVRPNIKGNTAWRCRCACGGEVTVIAAILKAGRKQSCGCLIVDAARAANQTHGMSKTPVYEVWCGMIRRCNDPRRKDYPRYGGRGISVCDEWKSFANFFSDMGEPPCEATLERRDNDGNYSATNCYWASRKQQGSNTSRTIRVNVDGAVVSLRQACEMRGLNYQNVYMRVRRGASIEEAMR